VEIEAIEDVCFQDPWSSRQHLEKARGKSCIRIACVNTVGVLVGYAVYTLCSNYVYLDRIAVDPEFIGLGAGRSMLDYIVDKSRRNARQRVVVDVPEVNLRALNFFKSQGFTARGVKRGYFAEDVDAINLVRLV
jgi:ribosomal-protein-alanine N-acetyltransferase